MERIQDINPDRIQWCCDERGITVEQLAEDVGIAATTIVRAMTGEASLTFNQLSRIAAYFNRGALFFLETTPVDEERIHTPQFRTLANQKPEISPKVKEIIERAEWQRDVFLSLREDLYEGDVFSFDPPDVPAEDGNRGQSALLDDS